MIKRLILSVLLIVHTSIAAATQAPAQTSPSPELLYQIALRIWQNEGRGETRYLTHWNKNEAFPSLGMGHFIWYPATTTERPYKESFPDLLRFMQAQGIALPEGISPDSAAKWPDRETFYAEFDSPQMTELRLWLSATFTDQARFIAQRLEESLPKILAAAPEARREHIRVRFDTVAQSANGVYALMDYVNFKGEGVHEKERYRGEGWGLLQVLDAMPDSSHRSALEDFAVAADCVLTRRVLNAPKKERQWLPGWRKRLETYVAP